VRGVRGAAACLLGAALLLSAGWTAEKPPPSPPAVAATPAPGPARPAPAAGSLRGWKSLTLKAEPSSLYTGSSTLEMTEGIHAASGRPAVILSTRSEARLLGAIGFEERTTSWIDAATRRPLELFHMRPGETARRFRFEPGQVLQTTWEPPADRSDAPFEQWREQETVTRKAVFADGAPVPADAHVTDPYALIHLVGGMDAAPGATTEFLVWKRRQVARLRVTVAGRRTRARDVTDESLGKVVSLTLAERRLDLTPSGEDGRDVRGLMGMRGPIEIWIDESSGAPVELRGDAAGLGPTVVSLASFRR
jgi:hypothetical protein